MKLGWSERWLMHNPLRPLFQKHFEMRRLVHLGGTQPNALVLEIGCGAGHGIGLLYDHFHVKQVHAFDLDARSVGQAAAKHHAKSHPTRLWVGNVRRIPADDATYDAVFDFGVLHHVRDWQSALGEIHRVLKPGGRFYIEEISRHFIVHPLWRRILDHPQENRFDLDELVTALKQSGFAVCRTRQLARLFIWCIADKMPDLQ